MTILWINLIAVYISSFFSRYFSSASIKEIPYIKPNKLLTIFVMVSLIIISGLRKNIGDTYYYMHGYVVGDFRFQDINFKGDFGFSIYQELLHYISSDPQILIFTTALITNFLIVFVLYKYSRMIELSLYVYITLGLFTVSMNGIRQFLAAAIIFTATKYILNGNFKKFIIVVLFAATIHKTALVFIPVYFIVRKKAWTKVTFILVLLSVLIATGFNELSKFLFIAISDTQYAHYQNYHPQGANILRVLVVSIPLIIAYFGKEKLRELWPKSDYIVNLSIIGFVFMVIATKNWLFARFDIYFGLYELILISWIVKLFNRNGKKIIYYGILVCYLIYFYYEQVISLNIIYKSNYM